jgi:hypothetical protein
MVKKILLLFTGLCLFLTASAQDIKSPSAFLGYELGTRFTPHHRVADYFTYVGALSKRVTLQGYGSTNEGRPLLAMFISSEKNIAKLEDIRKNNMALTGLEGSNGSTQAPVIVWLSYNVHGNEPSSTEAAMQTLFDLIDPANSKTKAWLENTVVVIDPCLNPDGRERYVNFYNSVKGINPDSDAASREHSEPWPGGRTNHYYFDLNRDWAWQTQKETQGRVALYNRWLPQVHVDFHEQGYNSPYYFAPAAEPMHKDITAWQKQFQTTIGKNNAKYFDKNGWLYFTKEEFDLLYPSYGDTYPIYNGSIGMTYEQGGIAAGLAVNTRLGDVLTLKDRIAHHHSNSLSTVETASANATKAVQEFKKYFDEGKTKPTGDYKGYVVKNDNQDKVTMLADLLKRNGIQYSFDVKGSTKGYNYVSRKIEQFEITGNDLVISAYQPKSVLVNVLMEPQTLVTDSNTYDITAWSLPYVYGLRAYALKEAVKSSPQTIEISPAAPPTAPAVTERTYAYVANWQSVNDVKFLTDLFKRGIKVRYAEKPFDAAGKSFGAGSLIIARSGNNDADFDKEVLKAAEDAGRQLTALNTGFVEKGVDIGSGYIHYIKPPKVMVVSGDEASSESLGEIWQFFEQQIGYPVTLVNYNNMGRAKLGDFDVIIFPDGDYDGFPSERLQGWVHDGGKLLVLQNTVGQLAGKKGFDIKARELDTTRNKPAVKAYADRVREAIKTNVPGAIYKMDIDNTHPLGFGFSDYYFTLKLSNDIYELLGDGGWNVGTIKSDGYMAGFVGQNSKQRLKNGLLLGVQSLGHGAVVYMVDDPLFRSFWEGGKLLFSNAVFMVGQ